MFPGYQDNRYWREGTFVMYMYTSWFTIESIEIMHILSDNKTKHRQCPMPVYTFGRNFVC